MKEHIDIFNIKAGVALAGFGGGISLAEINEILATISFLVGIAAGVLAIVRHFRDK